MKIEKMVNSKFYRGFEWFYRLILLNLLNLLISLSLAAIPFFIWYNVYYNMETPAESGGAYLIFICLILFAFAFVPSFIASFLVIKHYMEDRTGNVFGLFFRYLIDTIKKIYLIELILLIVFIILLLGLMINWVLLEEDYYNANFLGFLSIISFVVQFFLMFLLVLIFLNLTFIVAYFIMRPFDYLKLAFKFSFRYMLQTILYFLILIIPLILLSLMGMKFLPIYFIYGFSGPQFFLFLLTRNRFTMLARNLESFNKNNNEKRIEDEIRN